MQRRFAGAPVVALMLACCGALPAWAAGSPDTAGAAWGGAVLQNAQAWYGSAPALRLADSVLQYQSRQGGWPKNIDLATPPDRPQDWTSASDPRANTFDNQATTLPMQFLARVINATGKTTYRQAFERGLAYTLAAQYPNGGWPQYYPLRAPKSYYDHVTFNDDAMVNVLTLLRDVAAGQPPYGFVDPPSRALAASAVQRGLALILRTQIRHQGRLTAWCAQVDELTLEPAWARKFEPPSISGNESVGIVRWLMSLPNPSAEVVAAVDGAVAWFNAVAIHGQRYERYLADDGQSDRRVVPDPGAAPMWARFHELGTQRPIFLGRDSVVRYTLAEIDRERRAGYAHYGQQAAPMLAAYPAWRARATPSLVAPGN